MELDMHRLELTEGYNGKKITLEFSKDSDINDMKDIFRTLLAFLTFNSEQDWLD